MLVSGKGGTGKSAFCAALAIERARRGQRVLAIDMGAGTGLSGHLRTQSLSYTPQQVRPGLFAMTLVRSAALDEYLKTQLHVPTGAPTKTITSALSLLVDTAPGVREIISIGKPVFEVWKDGWDAVIVDTPSLGQFQSYLQAPATIAELVPTGNVRRQAAALATTLNDSETTQLVLVSTPAELPVNETLETVTAIASQRLGPRPQIVMNRLARDAGITPDMAANLPPGPIRDAAMHQIAVRSSQQRWATELDVDLELPFLMGVLTPGEVAAQLADTVAKQ